MSVKFSNNGHSTLAASLASNATSITVASGHGARFPSLSSGEYFYATLIDASNNLEIVKVTARSSDVLTATRAQEGTTARAYAIGDRIELRVTAQGLVDATNIDNIVPSQSGNSGKFLKTDGTNVSFDTAGSASATDLTTGTLPTARLPAGSVLQVQSIQSGTRVSTTHSSQVEPSTAYRVQITPTYASSKIFLWYHIPFNQDSAANILTTIRAFRIVGSGSKSYALTSAGNSNGSRHVIAGGAIRPQNGFDGNDMNIEVLHCVDLPNTTSQVTYGFETYPEGGNTTTFGYSANGSSVWGWDADIVITAMEVAV